MSNLEIRSIPAYTVDEESYLIREHPSHPWKRMTKSEIEKEYPNAFEVGQAPKDNLVIPRSDISPPEIRVLNSYNSFLMADHATRITRGLK